MRVIIGSDHAGLTLKNCLVTAMAHAKISCFDAGTHTESPVDYPDFAKAVAEGVRSGLYDRGIMICGSGVGASVAANKFKDIRAAICHDTYSAHQGVEHDDMNVLVLGARVIGTSLAREIMQAFLQASFSNEERHLRRLNKIKSFEN
jgi:ribose 5-phosphate isomerase B